MDSGGLPEPIPRGRAEGPEPRIVLVRRMALGDVVWATPLIQALRERNPEAEIHFLTDYPQVLENNPHLDGVNDLTPVREGTPGRPPDRVIELTYEHTPLLHLSQGYFLSAGEEFRPHDPEIFLTPEEKAAAGERLSTLDREGGPLIGLHPGVSWPERTWEWFKWDRLAALLISELGARVVFLGRSPDFAPVPWPGSLNLIDGPSLRELMALIEKLDLLVGIDSGPIHLASALGVPAVGIFGCVDPAARRPFAAPFRPVVHPLDCLGCHQRRPAPSLTAQCETGTYECMKGLTVEEVLAGVGEFLALPKAPRGWPGSASALPGWIRLETGPGGYPVLRVQGPGGRWVQFHSPRDPVAEGLTLARSIPRQRDAVVLGLGLGYHLAALLEDPERTGRVALVEREPDVFRAALSTPVLAPYLTDPRLSLIVGREPGECAWRLKTLPLENPEPLIHQPSFRFNPAYYSALAEHLRG